MPEFRGPAVDARGDEREHGVIFRVPVALDHLGAQGRWPEAEPFADAGFHPRVEMCMGADRAAQFAHAQARLGVFQAVQGAAKFIPHQGQLQAKSDRLRMDAVAASDHGRALEFNGPAGDDFAQVAQILQDQVRSFLHLHRERRVQHVAGGHALVHPSAGRPDVAGDVFQEGDDIVIGPFLDFRDFPEVIFSLGPDRFGIRRGDDPDFRLRLAGQGLDFEPDFVFALIRPDGGHFGSGITFDHRWRLGEGDAIAKRKTSGPGDGGLHRGSLSPESTKRPDRVQ